MADVDSSLEVPECYFWKMPQEVQDMIFELAYGIKSQHQMVEKPLPPPPRQTWGDWVVTEKPFTPKVQEFLVCKSWLLGAATAWIKAQTFRPVILSLTKLLSSGLIATCARDIDLSSYTSWHDLKVVRSHRNLRSLRIQLSANDFSADCKCRWIYQLGIDDFQSVPLAHYLIALRGLDNFELIQSSYDTREARTQDEKIVWKENVEAFKSYVKSFVLLPKDKSYVHSNTIVKSGPKPLYLGSRVCQGTSRLLPENYYQRYGEPFEIASDIIEPPSWDDMRMLTSSPTIEEPHADNALPETADELIQMLDMTPGQVWKCVQKAKNVGLLSDL